MRLTQLGHQVPRRNSTTKGPCSRKCFNETACGNLAASNMNSGARSPTSNVLLSFAIEGTVKQGRKPDNNGRNRGINKDSSSAFSTEALCGKAISQIGERSWERSPKESEVRPGCGDAACCR